MIKQIIIICITVFSLISCKTERKKTETEMGTPLVTVTDRKSTLSTQDYKVGSQVPNELVCMVNDTYMGKLQIPVPVNGKTYYGCCQMCVKTLNTKDEARAGIDPYTQNPIDKTEAYIVLINNEGGVAYFESEQNYQNFSKRLQ